MSSRTPGNGLILWGEMTEPERRAVWPKSYRRLFELEKATHSAEGSLRKPVCTSTDTRLYGGTAWARNFQAKASRHVENGYPTIFAF